MPFVERARWTRWGWRKRRPSSRIAVRGVQNRRWSRTRHDAGVDTKQFIASLVSSAAWPLAAFCVALLFRRQLAALLAAPVKRLKAGPVELEFERVLPTVQAVLEEELAPLPPEGEAPAQAPGPAQGPGPTAPPQAATPAHGPAPSAPFAPGPSAEAEPEARGVGASTLLLASMFRPASVRMELAGVAATSPGAAVLAAHARIVRLLCDLLTEAGEGEMGKRLSAPRLAELAVRKELIRPNVAKAVRELTDLRNSVAHGGEEPTPAAALDYLDLVDDVAAAILLRLRDGQ